MALGAYCLNVPGLPGGNTSQDSSLFVAQGSGVQVTLNPKTLNPKILRCLKRFLALGFPFLNVWSGIWCLQDEYFLHPLTVVHDFLLKG